MRPKKKAEEKRTIRQTVNFSQSEYQEAKVKADRLGIGFAEYLRISAVKLKVKEPSKDYAKLLAEMGRIGSNLNQIARTFNEHPNFTEKQKNGLNELFIKFGEIKSMIENE